MDEQFHLMIGRRRKRRIVVVVVVHDITVGADAIVDCYLKNNSKKKKKGRISRIQSYDVP